MRLVHVIFDGDVPLPGHNELKPFYKSTAQGHGEITATLCPELLSVLLTRGDKHLAVPLTRVKRYELAPEALATLGIVDAAPAKRPEPPDSTPAALPFHGVFGERHASPLPREEKPAQEKRR